MVIFRLSVAGFVFPALQVRPANVFSQASVEFSCSVYDSQMFSDFNQREESVQGSNLGPFTPKSHAKLVAITPGESVFMRFRPNEFLWPFYWSFLLGSNLCIFYNYYCVRTRVSSHSFFASVFKLVN